MAIRFQQKKEIVAEVHEIASNALSLVIADYRGVTSNDMAALRAKARAENVSLRVVRNTLARRAVEGTEYSCALEAFTGPSILAFSMADPGAAARLCKDFAKSNDKFEVRGLAVGGEFLGADQLDRLASLPTRDEALSMVMRVMLAPVTKLAMALNDVPGKVTRVVAAVRDQKKEAA